MGRGECHVDLDGDVPVPIFVGNKYGGLIIVVVFSASIAQKTASVYGETGAWEGDVTICVGNKHNGFIYSA